MPLGIPLSTLPGGHPGSAGYRPPPPPRNPQGPNYYPMPPLATDTVGGSIHGSAGDTGYGVPMPPGYSTLPGGHPGSVGYGYQYHPTVGWTPSPLPGGHPGSAGYTPPPAPGASAADIAAQAQYAAYQKSIQDQLAALGAGNDYNQQFYASQQALEQANTLSNQNYLQQGSGYDHALLDQDRYRTIDLGQERLGNLSASELADYNRNVANLDPLRGYIKQGYTNQLASNQLSHDTNYRTTSSDAIARGAIGSNGVNTNLGEIDTSLTNANNDASLTRDQGLTALQQHQADLDSAHKSALADEATQGKFIDSLAKDFGVRGEQIDAALKHGLEQLGYDGAKAQAALANAAAGSSSQAAAQAAALAQQAIALGLQNPAPPNTHPYNPVHAWHPPPPPHPHPTPLHGPH